MRVALFFDGKNFYSGWKDRTSGKRIDFVKLSKWLVEKVGGTFLWGAYYYTGIESDPVKKEPANLESFLETMELLPGFFVKRFPRKKRTSRCSSCHKENVYTTEKEVDTTMVADMLGLAAVGAFDILVLMSGDADHSPAVEGVRALGKQAYVASWGAAGLSSRLRKAAFDHIDLMTGFNKFEFEPEIQASLVGSTKTAKKSKIATGHERAMISTEKADASATEIFLEELKNAEVKFKDGYVGVFYFTTKWRSDLLDSSPVVRRRILNRLVDEGLIELYDTSTGEKAMRTKK